MKIYTKTGDTGETSLWGGVRVSKDHLRIEACGSVDELNCAVGVLRSLDPADVEDEMLGRIQIELFQLGAELASTKSSKANFQPITSSHIEHLEQAIDRYQEQLDPLRQFILPGGSQLGAQCHYVRAVSRRAERRVVTLANDQAANVSADVIKYLNRLSDFLFVLARFLNKISGATEYPWIP